jgi:hypothetical protein
MISKNGFSFLEGPEPARMGLKPAPACLHLPEHFFQFKKLINYCSLPFIPSPLRERVRVRVKVNVVHAPSNKSFSGREISRQDHSLGGGTKYIMKIQEKTHGR